MSIHGNPERVDNTVEYLHALDLRPTYAQLTGDFATMSRVRALWPALWCIQPMGTNILATPELKTPFAAALLGIAPHSTEPSVFAETSALEHLTSFVLDGALPPQTIVDRCVALETLVFAVRPNTAVRLPRTLRYVGFHPEKQDAVAPLKCLVIALRALPNLVLVTATRTLSASDLADMTSVCRKIHVELGLYRHKAMYRRIINQPDWI
ncbi:hypothetical protein FA95DRAFT_1607601 [Auriscalpium vulgare]|uniref:Uncharacterized protein n=1 Tax=Auriscalpium vulgare TaxID=40419 RepID=A0ACB8RP25_9AGAM|nr:hypothetical protein FA95DRAFT_1607601 [Auriscalpium vulgare]